MRSGSSRPSAGFTGLKIDHFAEIDLLGFINLSTIVGGVEVNLCQATSDPLSGADFPAGVQTIGGEDALKFVRQRHGLPAGDLDRVVRQQVYIGGMLRNMLSTDTLFDLGKQRDIVEQVGSSMTLDQGLDVFDLAAQLQGVQPGDITFQTIPGLTPTRIDGADVLEPPAADEVRSLLRRPRRGARRRARRAGDRGELGRPRLGDGAGPQRLRRLRRRLDRRGCPDRRRVRSRRRATPSRTDTTTVAHRTGDEAAAALVAAQVPGAAVDRRRRAAGGHRRAGDRQRLHRHRAGRRGAGPERGRGPSRAHGRRRQLHQLIARAAGEPRRPTHVLGVGRPGSAVVDQVAMPPSTGMIVPVR